jgi:hypothetical protein
MNFWFQRQFADDMPVRRGLLSENREISDSNQHQRKIYVPYREIPLVFSQINHFSERSDILHRSQHLRLIFGDETGIQTVVGLFMDRIAWLHSMVDRATSVWHSTVGNSRMKFHFAAGSIHEVLYEGLWKLLFDICLKSLIIRTARMVSVFWASRNFWYSALYWTPSLLPIPVLQIDV